MTRLPWSDLKVAYGIENPERFLKAYDRQAVTLPKGWTLTEIDCAGARCVVVFRCEVLPTVEDGRKVAAEIRRWGR